MKALAQVLRRVADRLDPPPVAQTFFFNQYNNAANPPRIVWTPPTTTAGNSISPGRFTTWGGTANGN